MKKLDSSVAHSVQSLSSAHRGQLKLFKNRVYSLKGILSSQFVFFRMPKVASQSIKQALDKNHGVKSTVIPHAFSPKTVRNILKLKSGSFRFSFVRHPYSRFVSAYKWATRENIDPAQYPLDIEQYKIVTSYPNMAAFAKDLADGKLLNSNRLLHFIRQSDWICDGDTSLVDYVGKLEQLDSSLTELKNAGLTLDLSYGANSKTSSPMQPIADPKLLAEQLNLSHDLVLSLNKYYAQDFKLYNYGIKG